MSTKASGGYSIARREDAHDFIAQYPGYGEQRWYRHPRQEEVYFVISGTVTFNVGDDVFEAPPQTAVRMTGDEYYSVHNDTESEAQLLIFSMRLTDPPVEKRDGFWP